MIRTSRRPPHRCPMHHRAFVATTTAIALIGLASVALTAVVAATVADVRRTRQLETDAQVRQLLLAGAFDAAEHAKAWGDVPTAQSWELSLPAVLAERGYRVRVSVLPPDEGAKADSIEIRVNAASPSATREQALRFRRRGSGWKPVG